MTDKEIQETIDKAINAAKDLAGKHEQYHPSDNNYRFHQVEEKLDGQKITENGLKYTSEITKDDYPAQFLGNTELNTEDS